MGAGGEGIRGKGPVTGAHDPEKWEPVFGEDHAPINNMTVDRVLNGLLKLVVVAAVIAGAAFAAIAVRDQLTLDRQAAERRALLQRDAELTIGALAPGSALACLDAGAGETIENACESQVFADPQTTASAVAYTGARLALLADASTLAQAGERSLGDAFAATRRALELDRYGIAAHVLAARDGCTAEKCAAFAWLRDTTALKANLKAQVFDQYVSRYAAAWNKAEPDGEPVAEKPAGAPVASAAEPPPGHPVSSKYDFPSAASIPPVSIMNSEPPLPKAAADAQAKAEPKADAQAAQPKSEADVPVPPKRPQAPAVTPPAR